MMTKRTNMKQKVSKGRMCLCGKSKKVLRQVKIMSRKAKDLKLGQCMCVKASVGNLHCRFCGHTKSATIRWQ